MAISSPAGPQVAKYTLLLFVWPACSILALSPSAEQPLILLWEERMESRRAKRHLAGISHPGWIQLMVPEPDCFFSVWALMMTPFQVSTCVLLLWSLLWPCREGISSSRTLSSFPSFSTLISIERLSGLQGVRISIFYAWPKIDVHMSVWLECLSSACAYSNIHSCIKILYNYLLEVHEKFPKNKIYINKDIRVFVPWILIRQMMCCWPCPSAHSGRELWFVSLVLNY